MTSQEWVLDERMWSGGGGAYKILPIGRKWYA